MQGVQHSAVYIGLDVAQRGGGAGLACEQPAKNIENMTMKDSVGYSALPACVLASLALMHAAEYYGTACSSSL